MEKRFRIPRRLHAGLILLIPPLGFFIGLAAMLAAMALLKPANPGDWRAPAIVTVIAIWIAATIGSVYGGFRLHRRIAVPCIRCGGDAFICTKGGLFTGDENLSDIRYLCRACNHAHSPFFNMEDIEWEQQDGPFKRFLVRTSIVWRLPLIFVSFGMIFTMFLGMAGPIVIGMFVMAYGIGIVFNILVRLVPQRHPANRPMPWKDYLLVTFGTIFIVMAVTAVCRGMMALPIALGGRGHTAAIPAVVPGFDTVIGGCGLLYGLIGFLREGWWRLKQARQAGNLATSTARGAAVGLSEFKGIARSPDTMGGEPDGRAILSSEWGMFSKKRFIYGEGNLSPFYLLDDTGKILVDPSRGGIEYAGPAISILATLFGRRYSEIVLTRHVKRGYWPNRRQALRDGDPVYVIGNVEEFENVPPDATGPDRLVVRPSPEGRQEESLVLHLIYPLIRRPRRDVFDVFFISDTTEDVAARILYRGFLLKLFWAILWGGLSGVLFVLSILPFYDISWLERF